MRGLAIARRQLAALLGESTGWLLLAGVAIVQALHGVAFAVDERRSAETALGIYFHHAGYGMEVAALMLALVVAVRDAPAQLLGYGAPVRSGQWVAAQYAGGLGWVALASIASLALPLLVRAGGAASVGHVVAGAVGLFAVGALALAMAEAAIALSGRPVVGTLLAATVLGAMELGPLVADRAPAGLRTVLGAMAPVWTHLGALRRGIVDARDLAFFAGVAAVAGALAVVGREERRWGR